MKLIVLFLVLGLLQVAAKSTAQVTLKENAASLEKVLLTIKGKSGLDLFFDRAILKAKARPVTLTVKDVSVEEALKQVFKDQPELTYTLEGKIISVKEKTVSNSTVNLLLPPPPIDLHGTVKDETGKPVAGASVQVKGMNKGTTTNNDGEFILTGVDDQATLVISAVNIETREVSINGRKEINLVAKVKVSKLEDVEIVANTGYQQVRPNEAAGSIAVIGTEKLEQQTGSTILKRLEGVTSGVLFDNRISGQKKLNFVVRGYSTINGPQDPLIVVDNFPYEGDINNINPNDVESITLLKDAAAASIWGTRAGNGVVVITTKKGKFNQPVQVSANVNTLITETPNLLSLRTISSGDYIDVETMLFAKGYYNSVLTNTSSRPAVSPVVETLDKRKRGLLTAADSATQIDALRRIDSRNQFSEYVYRQAVARQYAVNVSGGSNNASYYLSAGYDKSMSQVGANNERFTIRSENRYRPFQNLQVSVGIQYTQSNTDNGGPLFGSVRTGSWLLPYVQLADINGKALPVATTYRDSYTDTAGAGLLQNWKYYPLDEAKYSTIHTSTQDVLANLSVKYNVLRSLSLDVNYLYEKQSGNTRNLKEPESYGARDLINRFTQITRTTGAVKYIVPVGGILGTSGNVTEVQNIRAQMNFDRGWKEHHLSAIGGAEIRETKNLSDGNLLYGYNPLTASGVYADFVNSYPTFVNGSASTIPGSGTILGDVLTRYVSFYSNLAYTYRGRYILTASARKDASNMFGVASNDKWKPLWSAALGWKLSDESFYKIKWLPYMKLRASFGYSGNVDPSKTAVTTISYAGAAGITNLQSAGVSNFPNPELRWEQVQNLNIGFDFQTSKQLINGSLDVYYKKGIDLFGASPFDPTTGLNGLQTLTRNVANMKGSGVEITLAAKPFSGTFTWNTELLFNYGKSITTNYYVDSNRRAASFLNSGVNISPVPGEPLYSIVSLKWAGLDAAGNPQGYLNKAISADYNSIINTTRKEDLNYRNGTPTIFGSWINTVNWKGLSLTVNIKYRLGYYFAKPTINYGTLFSSGAAAGYSDYALRWQKPGDENKTSVPSLVYPAISNRDQFYNYADMNALRADNIKLQYINIGYDMGSLLKQYNVLKKMQLYVNISNLGILWKANKEGIDPDYTGFTPDPGKTYTIGIRANF